MFWDLKCKIGICATIILIIAAVTGPAFADVQPLQAKLKDGVTIRVHLLEELAEDGRDYPEQVLAAACAAYKEVVFNQGFNRPGYTFAQANKDFAYDKDAAIDIYIADVDSPVVMMEHSGSVEYEAKIFVPSNFKEYRRKYQIDQPLLELKASLAHEFLHIVTYCYNRNMQIAHQGMVSVTSKRWDWYNEGLARYFEALVGYRTEFLSSGFRETYANKIIVYKGGVNYFFKYPDKPLNERKYDFAVFWQYIDQNYGMEKIEEISFRFRELDPKSCTNQEAMQVVAESLETSLDKLMREFSYYLYKTSSVTNEENGFKPVAITELSPRKFETLEICSFGFDFYEVELKDKMESVQIEGIDDLNCFVAIASADGSLLLPVEEHNTIDTTTLTQNGKMIIMLSNPTDETIAYRISLN